MNPFPLDSWLPPGCRPASEITVRGWLVARIMERLTPADAIGKRRSLDESVDEILVRVAIARADLLIRAVHAANVREFEQAQAEDLKTQDILDREEKGQAAKSARGES